MSCWPNLAGLNFKLYMNAHPEFREYDHENYLAYYPTCISSFLEMFLRHESLFAHLQELCLSSKFVIF